MGLEVENDSSHRTDFKFCAGSDGVDFPLNYDILGDLGYCNFGPMLTSQDMTEDPLNNSLLNKGFEAASSPFSMAKSEPSENISANGQDSAIARPQETVSMMNAHNEHQHRALSSSTGMHTGFSHVASSNAIVNTNPTSIATHRSRPSMTRPSSLLRNEYRPETPPIGSSSTMAGHAHPQAFTSSPSRYVLRAQPGPLPSQTIQPFQESNMRSSYHQHRTYNTIHQLGYDPNFQVTQSQPHSAYPDPRHYAHNPSSQASYGLLNQQTPQCDGRHAQQLAITHPSTPPNTVASRVRSDQSSTGKSMSSPSSDSIKREQSTSGSPVTKKESRKGARRKPGSQLISTNEGGSSLTEADARYVEDLIHAMTDGTDAEDNPGMQNTWNKIRENKAANVREKCIELLDLLKRAQHEQLVDRKAANPYPDFDHRFEEMCVALKTQKTICKHLLEAPYSHTVANDPTYAAQRVRNNRRVNGQKRQAITMGRQALGLQGQGKGKTMKRIEPIPLGDFDYGDDSGDDPFADEDDAISTPPPTVKMQISGRKQKRKIRKPNPDDDYVEQSGQSPAPKKPKRERRSTYTGESNGQMANASAPCARSSNRPSAYLSTFSSSPIQHPDLAEDQRGTDQFGYYHTDHVYAPTAPSLPAMLPEFYENYQPHSSPFEHFAHQSLGHSSGKEQDHSDQPATGNEANFSGPALGHKTDGHPGSSH